MVITQHGEARAVMLDVKSYEDAQKTLALLKMLAIGNRQVLVPKCVDPDYIFGACVSNETVRAEVSAIAPGIETVVNAQLFFR